MSSTLFKIKFAFKEIDEKGKEVKSKLEVIAQCENYTDAEKLAVLIIEDYEMDKIETPSYEIVKLRFTVHDILYTDIITYQKGSLFHGLVQNYFEDETSGIYIVNISVYGDKENKVNGFKATYCIPASDAANAVIHAKNRMSSSGWSTDSYTVTSSKMDNAIELYLQPDTQEALLDGLQKK